jgi:hypothetical protein
MKMRTLKILSLVFLSAFCVLVYGEDLDFKELRSDHFLIYYAPEALGSIYKIRDGAEYCYRMIVQEFGLTQANLWAWENRAKIFIAKDKQDYLNKFNCPPWSAACVNYFRRIIYTYPAQESFKSILSHELTHIIFREYIGFQNLPLWVDEGMAAYISKGGTYEEQTSIATIKQLISKNEYIPFSQINNIYSLDARVDTAIFYNQSFSIIYFLRKRFGRENFSQFLTYLKNGSNINDAIRQAFAGMTDMKSLEEVWKRFYLL